MSRITEGEARGLMDAYRSIYEGYGEKKEKSEKKKVKHDCATHGEHAEWGVGSMIKEMHTLDEEGNITHYDVIFEHGIEKNVPVEDLVILEGEMHEHYVNDEKNAEVFDEDIKSFSDKGGLLGSAQRAFSRSGTEQGKAQNRAAVGNVLSGINRGASNLMQTGGVFGRGGLADRALNKPKPTFQNTSGDGRYAPPAMQQRTPGAKPPGGTPPGAKPPGGTPPGAKPPAAKVPPASTSVLAKQGGVEGKLDKSTGKFTAGAFTGAEKTRYDARAPKPATPAAKPSSYNPLMQKTFGYQTGNAPDQIAKASAGAPPTPSGGALGAAAKPEVRKALNLPVKPATPTQATAAAPSTSAPASGDLSKTTAKLAATPKPTPVAPGYQGAKKPFAEEVDAYDLVLDYLLENGHADSVDEAHYVMLEMDSKMIKSIVEGGINFSVPSRIDDFNNRRDELKNRYKQDVGPRIPGPGGGGQYGEPSAPKATGVRLARGTSSSNRGKESKNQA